MITKADFAEMQNSLKYDLYELHDDYDESGDRLTVLNEEEKVLINVEYYDERDSVRRAGYVIKTPEEFATMIYDEFIRLLNELWYYAQPVE